MSLIGGHLGARASALLDGQLPPAEEERAWAHVEECDLCHHQLEREGWLKRRLAGLGVDPCASAPATLKGSLLGACEEAFAASEMPYVEERSSRRTLVLVAAGGGAVGAAMVGLFAFAASPADAPPGPRNVPITAVTPMPATSVVAHVRR
ncbi:MAG: hypothetical protein J2O46_06340 [Nocardioides sp.]|nr:hypothetical protein [Nocardioides sp.]